MKTLRLCILVGLAGASWAVAAQPSQSQQTLPAALASCRAVADAAARLACYDSMGQPAARPGSGQSPVTAEAAKTVPAVAPLATTAAALPQQARPAAPADFGLPQVRQQSPSDMIESRIDGRFEGWDPGTRLRLVNGQVWEVLENNRVSYGLDKPGVRVKRGMLGSFFMEIDGVSATLRVRRVQ